MNWIKENKSQAAVFGVMIVGAVGLGALLFTGYSKFSSKGEEWTKVRSDIKRLESEALYPSDENSKKKASLVAEYGDHVNLLRTALLNPKVQLEVKPVAEIEFQDNLVRRIATVKAAAEKAGVNLPADFALGFNTYTGNLPRNAAAAAELAVQLQVLEKLMTVLIEAGVNSVDSLERAPLPIETSDVASATTEEGADLNGTQPILDRYTIKTVLTSDQAPLQAVINTLSDPAKMSDFTVVRLVRIENEKSDSPLKTSTEENFDVDATESTEGTPAVSEVKADAEIILGNEKLKTYLEIDYVRFRPLPTTEEAPTAE